MFDEESIKLLREAYMENYIDAALSESKKTYAIVQSIENPRLLKNGGIEVRIPLSGCAFEYECYTFTITASTDQEIVPEPSIAAYDKIIEIFRGSITISIQGKVVIADEGTIVKIENGVAHKVIRYNMIYNREDDEVNETITSTVRPPMNPHAVPTEGSTWKYSIGEMDHFNIEDGEEGYAVEHRNEDLLITELFIKKGPLHLGEGVSRVILPFGKTAVKAGNEEIMLRPFDILITNDKIIIERHQYIEREQPPIYVVEKREVE